MCPANPAGLFLCATGQLFADERNFCNFAVMMEGTITIDRLRVYARHGVMEQERRVGNEYEVTLSVTLAMDRALTEDDLTGTMNYATAVDIIRREMAVPSRLIENVAWRIKQAVTAAFPAITAGSVVVTKVCPPMGAQVAGVSCSIKW